MDEQARVSIQMRNVLPEDARHLARDFQIVLEKYLVDYNIYYERSRSR